MWYVVEVEKVSPLYKSAVLWGPFPGHEHAHRWVEVQKANAAAGEDHRFTIRQLNRVE